MPSGDTYGVLYRNNINYSHDAAESISFDNTHTGLSATTVKDALDSLMRSSMAYPGQRYKILDVTDAGQGSQALSPKTSYTISNTYSGAVQAINSGKFALKFVFCVNGTGDYDTTANVSVLTYRKEGNWPLLMNTADNPVFGTLYITITANASDNSVTFTYYTYPDTPVMKLYRFEIIAI